MKLFPELPADLAAASDDELAQLRAQHLEAVTKIKTGDAEFLGDLAAGDIVAEMQTGVEQLEQIKNEESARAEAQKAAAPAKVAPPAAAPAAERPVNAQPADRTAPKPARAPDPHGVVRRRR